MTTDELARDIIDNCLLSSNGDEEAALLAAQYIAATQPLPDEVEIEQDDDFDDEGNPPTPVDFNTFLSFDIYNRQAQGILNRSLQAAKGLSATARKDLAAALKQSATGSGEAILNFIDKYRVQLAKVLTATQLAAVLAGAKEVAVKVPSLTEFPGAIPPPPTLEPHKAIKLAEQLEKLDPVEQAEKIIELTPTEQVYIKQVIAARAAPPPNPPAIIPKRTGGGAPEDIHLPIIDEAVRTLSERNVMDRQRYDALEAAARAKAFTVANVEAEETLTKIRDSLAENVRKGADYKTWRKKVLADVDEGTFLSDAHQETVFRTNVQTGFSDGQESILQHPLVRSGFPYRARDAIHDDRVRHNHLALEKLGIQGTNIYRADDPVWQLFRAPWDYNDRCSDTAMTVRQAADAGINEAKEWLKTGVEPTYKAFVPMPDFQPPPGFRRAISSAPMSVQLSMQPVMTFSANKKPEEETETSELFGQPEVGAIGSATLDTAHEGGRGKGKDGKARRMKVGRAKTGKGRLVRRSLFKRLRVKRKWSPASLSIDENPNDRIELISDILILLFGDKAVEAAKAFLQGTNDITLAIGNPNVKKRYGKKPGPGWTPGGVSSKGVQIWIWGPSSNPSSVTMRGFAPPVQPQQQPLPPPVQPQQPSPQQQSPPIQPVLRVGGQRARAASIATFNDIMAKLNNGQQLTSADLKSISTKLTNMPTDMLRRLYTSLLDHFKGSGVPASSLNRQAVIFVVKGIVSPSTQQPQTTPVPPTTASTKQSVQPSTQTEDWKTGVPKPGTLNGIKFESAPPKFWESTPDVDVGEPPSLKKVNRVGIIIKEPDGRIWIVQPTNQFGNRKYTLPGGGVEPGLTDQQNALKEVWEETGLQVKITGHLGDFEDSNNSNNGRLYVGERVGGAPWDAKVESHIIDSKTGKPAAESSAVTLVTPEKAASLLHRTDDLAQLMTVNPIKLDHPVSGRGSEPLKKFMNGIAPTVTHYKNGKRSKGEQTGNAELHAVQNMRGFNKRPKVVKKDDMDALLGKGGHIELLRGVRGYGNKTARDLAKEFMEGEHFPGHGVFGSGTYTDSTSGYNNIAYRYGAGSGGSGIRMALPKSAKIIKQSELERKVPRNPDSFSGYNSHGAASECWQGVQAALAGYDAIYVDGNSSRHGSYGKGVYIVLNRGILTVQMEDAKGHNIP